MFIKILAFIRTRLKYPSGSREVLTKTRYPAAWNFYWISTKIPHFILPRILDLCLEISRDFEKNFGFEHTIKSHCSRHGVDHRIISTKIIIETLCDYSILSLEMPSGSNVLLLTLACSLHRGIWKGSLFHRGSGRFTLMPFSWFQRIPSRRQGSEIACFTDAENITTLFVNSTDRRPNTRIRTSDPCFPKTE